MPFKVLDASAKGKGEDYQRGAWARDPSQLCGGRGGRGGSKPVPHAPPPPYWAPK